MDYPIPTHLQPYMVPIGEENSEYEVTGSIHCSCGCEEFKVRESNDRQIVNIKCIKCGKEILIFDSGKHGWNGFVCKDDYLDRTLPEREYICPKCGKDSFRIHVWISSQGKEDFSEECVTGDDTFSIDDWVDGFEWIVIALYCQNCSFEEEEWVDFETM